PAVVEDPLHRRVVDQPERTPHAQRGDDLPLRAAGCALGIVRGGKPIVARGSGMADGRIITFVRDADRKVTRFTVELWSIQALRFERERRVRSASPAGADGPCDDRANRTLFQLEGPSMNRILGATLVLVLGLPVPAGHKGGGKPATPAEQYRALLKEYQD